MQSKGGLGSTIVNLSVPGETGQKLVRKLAEQYAVIQGNTAFKGGKQKPSLPSIYLRLNILG